MPRSSPRCLRSASARALGAAGLLWALRASAGSAGPVCLDPSFADGGVFIHDVGGVRNLGFTAQGLALQPDGKLVLGGIGGAPPHFNFVTLRLLTDGALDPSFGDGGIAEVDLGGSDHSFETVEVQPGGSITIAGSLDDVVLPDGGVVLSTGVAQLTPEGRPDLSFGDAGVLHPRSGLGTQLVNGQAGLPDGRHRLAGQCQLGGRPGFINLCVIGLLADGRADPSFGDGGLVEIDFTGYDEFGGVLTRDSQGRLLVPGTTYNATIVSRGIGFNFGLARLLPTGEYDPTFSDDGGFPGRVTTDFFGKRDSCNVVHAQPDGRIVCGGDADTPDGGMRFALARYLASGTLDPSFGDAGGKLAFDFGGRQGVRALLTLPDLTLVAGGYATNPAGDTDFVVAFLDPSGALDARFGDAGTLRIDVTPGRDDAVHTLQLDALGRLVVYGEAGDPSGNNLVVLRLRTCAGPDAGIPDAGTTDAGSRDAGDPDAGPPDAGPASVGPADAGGGDGGPPDEPGPRHLVVGCDCQAVPPGAWMVWAVALAGVTRRRKRHASHDEVASIR